MANDLPPIHHACSVGDIESVRNLLASDPHLVDADDQHNWRPVFHAALRQHIDVVRLLIAHGTDLSAHDGDVLHYAAEVPGNKEIVTLLVQHGVLDAHVRPQCDLSRQLLSAVFLGDEQRVSALLDQHPNLATTLDGRGELALHHAARNGDTGIVRVLVDAGSDVNQPGIKGHTVLYCAGGHGHVETVRFLLDAGSDPDVRFTHDGKTLFEWLQQYPDDERLRQVAILL